MASYNVKIDEDTIIKTLNFKGKTFIEKWEEGGVSCKICIEAQVEQVFPKLEDSIFETIENLSTMYDLEIIKAMKKLTDYELHKIKE